MKERKKETNRNQWILDNTSSVNKTLEEKIIKVNEKEEI